MPATSRIPRPGQGIADALRQAERLSEAIGQGLREGELDRRLRAYWRWRDRDALERHAWAHAFGAAGPPQHVLIEAQRTRSRPEPERFWGPSLQRMKPRRALGRATLARAALSAVASGRVSAPIAARELAQLARRDARYRRAQRTAPATHTGATLTRALRPRPS